jgi:UDP-glucose 4-epimerase
MKRTDEHNVFNIGAGQGYSLNDLLNIIEKTTGLTSKRIYSSSRAFDVPVSILSILRAKEFLCWEPKVTFENGIDRFSKWLSRNPE